MTVAAYVFLNFPPPTLPETEDKKDLSLSASALTYLKKQYQSATLPPPLPVPAGLPPIASDAPGAFRVVALPENFEASAINNKGDVVGTWNAHAQTSISDTASNAAIWCQGQVRLLPRLNNTPQCTGICLSDNGLVGGSAGHIYIDPMEDPSLAVVWNAADKKPSAHSLGQLPHLSRATVLALNTKGQAVGTSGSSCDGEMRDGTHAGVPFLDVTHAFFWDGQTMQDLGEGEVCGINERGQVVGTQNKKIVLWQSGKAYILGDGKAYAINNRGQMVGTSDIGPQNPPDEETAQNPAPPHALLWNKGAFQDLGALNGDVSTALALNDREQVVGCSTYGGDTRPEDVRAFLWQAGKMHDLNTLIPPRSGWVLHNASSINNKGQIIGVGTINNKQRSFLLTPTRTNRERADRL